MNAKKKDVPAPKRERDPDFVNTEIALKRAAQKARQRASQAGVGVIVMQDGWITEELPDNAVNPASPEISDNGKYRILQLQDNLAALLFEIFHGFVYRTNVRLL
jgi:hypothetical protein